MDRVNPQNKNLERRYIRISALILFLLSLFYLSTWVLEQVDIKALLWFTNQTNNTEETTTSIFSVSASRPIELRVDTVGITAPFEKPLELNEDGSVEVPEQYTTVGWYKHGPTPGELGPAVILGHVDSIDGPGVFYSLGQVEIGDTIEVLREDDSTVHYTITNLQRIAQEAFPTQEVYGSIPYAGIRLITCTGVYDKGIQRYSHNLIVYGTLTDVEYASTSNTTMQ